MPDILLMLSEEIAIVDNLSGKLTLVVYAEPGFPGAWKQAQARLKELLAKLREPAQIPAEQHALPPPPAVSEFGEEAFKAAVRRAKEYIVDGDIMQVVLSPAHEQALRGDAAVALPGAAHAQSLALHVLLRLRGFPCRRRLARDPGAAGGAAGKLVTLRPIAGTRGAARRRRRTRRWRRNCWPTRRSAPST